MSAEDRGRERRRAGGRSRGSRPPATTPPAPASPGSGAGPTAADGATVTVPAAVLLQLRQELSALIALCDEPPPQLSADGAPSKA